MSLRATAEADLEFTLEDSGEWGYPIKVTDPAGLFKTINGQAKDISQLIDPDTGQAVSGRLAAVTLRISTLTSDTPGPALALPEGIADPDSRPWVIEFDDINGNPHVFKVSESDPDRTIGLVVLLLEKYNKP